MRRAVLTVALVLLACWAVAQTLSEMNAVVAGNDALNAASPSGAASPAYMDRARNATAAANANVAGTATISNPGALGFPAPIGNVAPTPVSSIPGLNNPVSVTGVAAPAPAAPMGVAGGTPTPVPTIKVLVGQRVYCAVCGMLLEDATQLQVPQNMQDKYLDDGVHDNGIENDGIRGDVKTVKNEYIGQECNSIKNRLVNVVRNAESIDLMAFFGYHVMGNNPLQPSSKVPQLLPKEEQRDALLRDWNNKFLADYRIDKNDPKSEFFKVYVPQPPLYPRYPVPPGYAAPQKLKQEAAGGAAPGATPNIYNGDQTLFAGAQLNASSAPTN